MLLLEGLDPSGTVQGGNLGGMGKPLVINVKPAACRSCGVSCPRHACRRRFASQLLRSSLQSPAAASTSRARRSSRSAPTSCWRCQQRTQPERGRSRRRLCCQFVRAPQGDAVQPAREVHMHGRTYPRACGYFAVRFEYLRFELSLDWYGH